MLMRTQLIGKNCPRERRNVDFKFNCCAFVSQDPRTALKNQLSGSRKLAYTHPESVQDIKTFGRVFGATINDVALAAIAGSLRKHLIETGTDPSLLSQYVHIDIFYHSLIISAL